MSVEPPRTIASRSSTLVEVAKEQEIEIGHYSGESNVVYWLKKRGYEATPELVAAVLGEAKRGNRTLTDDEVVAVIKAARA